MFFWNVGVLVIRSKGNVICREILQFIECYAKTTKAVVANIYLEWNISYAYQAMIGLINMPNSSV